jgi:hypothetical protein
MTTSTFFPASIPFLLLVICYNPQIKIIRAGQGRAISESQVSSPKSRLLPTAASPLLMTTYKDLAEKANRFTDCVALHGGVPRRTVCR